MKRFIVISFFTVLFCSVSLGQDLPPVGIIDVYGLRGKVSQRDVLSKLTIRSGDAASTAIMAKEVNQSLLRSLPNVADASISLVCCDDADGRSMIFVGIREKGTPALRFRTAPIGVIRLPDEILRAGREYEEAFLGSVNKKDFSEDDKDGNAFFGDTRTRSAQARFPGVAARNLTILRQVLRGSADAGQRALAAEIIAYHPNKKAIIGDLIGATGDPASEVRNNSTRALIIIIRYSLLNPKLGIRVPTSGFVRMLDSTDWTDRNKSIGVIEALTATKRDAGLLAELQKSAVPALKEMALWKNPGHAKGAFYVLGRVARLKESEIEKLWLSGSREDAVRTIAAKVGANSR